MVTPVENPHTQFDTAQNAIAPQPDKLQIQQAFVDHATRYFAGVLDTVEDDDAHWKFAQSLRQRYGLPLLTDADVIEARTIYDSLRQTINKEQRQEVVRQTQEIIIADLHLPDSLSLPTTPEEPAAPVAPESLPKISTQERQLRSAAGYVVDSLKNVSEEQKPQRIAEINVWLGHMGTSVQALADCGKIDKGLLVYLTPPKPAAQKP